MASVWDQLGDPLRPSSHRCDLCSAPCIPADDRLCVDCRQLVDSEHPITALPYSQPRVNRIEALGELLDGLGDHITCPSCRIVVSFAYTVPEPRPVTCPGCRRNLL